MYRRQTHIVCMIVCQCFLTAAYKHVIFMHGILSGPWESSELEAYIQQVHPGTNVTSIDAFTFLGSLTTMWTQVYKIQIQVHQIMEENPEGIHLICYSQGGLICRGLLSILQHNVESFVSLSSPLAGQFGDTVYLKYLFPTYLKENLYKFFYTERGQNISVANYWNDPHHQELYRMWATYLPVLNNETHNEQSFKFKENFLRLKTMVLVGGPDDGVIAPWQSSQFGSFDSNETVIPMREQKWYINDSFGLLTLDKRKAVHLFTHHGVQHVHWYRNRTIFDCCIEPYLT
ncbi:lysosomal thioesterase PPT2-like [Gigantopelta aegis]|uniref:lysosomal thioesterase PPT2-like n=1 Tax=Gigantopelta aegis TaxID=1735272 RepID=UPI001B88BC5A|nr:lysosomal thioesterase PPT2-like [Gigantopelta aegis]